MQRWNSNQTKEGKSGEQRGSEFEDAEAAQVDHETKDAGETAALGMTEPGSIYFYHSGRTECLHVSIDAANHHEQPKESPKSRSAEKDVHNDRRHGSDKHRPFSTKTIGEETIQD